LADVLWVSAALGMSLALVVMMVTKTTHPPGDINRFGD
jgi:CBS-domain-containing membrane protein